MRAIGQGVALALTRNIPVLGCYRFSTGLSIKIPGASRVESPVVDPAALPAEVDWDSRQAAPARPPAADRAGLPADYPAGSPARQRVVDLSKPRLTGMSLRDLTFRKRPLDRTAICSHFAASALLHTSVWELNLFAPGKYKAEI